MLALFPGDALALSFSNLTDGNPTTVYKSTLGSGEIIIDLGAVRRISNVKIHGVVDGGPKYYTFRVNNDASPNWGPDLGLGWYHASNATTTHSFDFPAVSVRYLNVWAGPGYTGNPTQIREIEVSGPDDVSRSSPSVVDDHDPTIAYAGSWGWGTYHSGELFGTAHWTAAQGSTATYKFFGRSISVITGLAPDHGDMAISIDNGPEQIVSAYNSGYVKAQTVFTKTGLASNVLHTIRVRHATGVYMDIDGFRVNKYADDVGVAIVDNRSSSIVYEGGSWGHQDGSANGYGDYAGGISYVGANGASATLTFTGTGVALLGQRNSDRGDYSVSIDNGPATIVNANGLGFCSQNVLFSQSGLTYGTHTIKVTKVNGTWMDVDAFLVYGGP